MADFTREQIKEMWARVSDACHKVDATTIRSPLNCQDTFVLMDMALASIRPTDATAQDKENDHG